MTGTVAIIQARTGSTRLPNKVLEQVAGEPLLARVVDRTRRATRVDDIVVATTTLQSDDAIGALCRGRGWPVSRGSESDLLDRYVQAARTHNADAIVRITSDCPLIDPELIDLVVEAFGAGDWDYASNSLEPRTYPRGLDVEVIARDALERAWTEDQDPAWREHATPYLYRHPERFRLLRVAGDEDHSDQRWTVDTTEDLELVRRIYGALGRDDFGWRDVLEVVGVHPEWLAINRHVRQKVVRP